MNVLAISEKLGLDYDEALEYFGGDVAALKAKLATLREDADFDAVLDAKTDEELEAAAHRVRKAAEKVCLMKLAKEAEAVEKEHAALDSLRAEWDETVKVLFPEN